MIAYILRRLGISLLVVVGVTLITFLLLDWISPSPGRALLGLRASDAAVAAFNKVHGYDEPVWTQYWTYMTQLVFHGNLGHSYSLNESVTTAFGQYAGRSALLTLVALALSIVIAIPLGIYQALYRNSIGDYVMTTGAFVTYSMPAFLLGTILIDIFGIALGWLPSEASQCTTVVGVIAGCNNGGTFMPGWTAMILPVATLTGLTVASFSRYMRSAALDVLAQDYITVAKAKGLSQRMVLTHHLLRNACLPIVTLVGLSIPALLAGNLITETVFNYHGLGLFFYNALQRQDEAVLIGYTLVGAALTVLGNLIADIALSITDPRIRLA